jgi:hypothetical protein
MLKRNRSIEKVYTISRARLDENHARLSCGFQV